MNTCSAKSLGCDSLTERAMKRFLPTTLISASYIG